MCDVSAMLRATKAPKSPICLGVVSVESPSTTSFGFDEGRFGGRFCFGRDSTREHITDTPHCLWGVDCFGTLQLRGDMPERRR